MKRFTRQILTVPKISIVPSYGGSLWTMQDKLMTAIAARAPSGTNMQPWCVHVVAGEVKEKLSRAIVDAHEAGGEEQLDRAGLGDPPGLPDAHRQPHPVRKLLRDGEVHHPPARPRLAALRAALSRPLACAGPARLGTHRHADPRGIVPRDS